MMHDINKHLEEIEKNQRDVEMVWIIAIVVLILFTVIFIILQQYKW